MSKWAYIPNVSYTVLGKTLVSQRNDTYQDKFVYERFLDIPYGYIAGINTWPVVEYSLKINFVKLLDSSLPEVVAIKSFGIYEGCTLTKKSPTSLALSAGIAFFPQGRKVISAQSITLPSGNTEAVLYVYMDYAGTITIPSTTYNNTDRIRLGSVTMNGDTILQVYTILSSFMPGSIRKFSDFAYELGPWLSGATHSFNTTTGILSRLAGFINGFYQSPIRVTKSNQIKITKVYKGDVLGQSYQVLTLADLKEVSTQGGGTALTTGQIITHALAIDPATLETYLFISDSPRSGADNSITTQSIITDLSNFTKGELFTRFCVLFGAIVVRFSDVTLGNTSFVVLHRGLSGSRAINIGEYPSPIDYPDGGVLKAKANKYVIESDTLADINKIKTENPKNKYLIQNSKGQPDKVQAAEYGSVSNRVLQSLYFNTIYPRLCQAVYSKDKLFPSSLYLHVLYDSKSNSDYTTAYGARGRRYTSSSGTTIEFWSESRISVDGKVIPLGTVNIAPSQRTTSYTYEVRQTKLFNNNKFHMIEISTFGEIQDSIQSEIDTVAYIKKTVTENITSSKNLDVSIQSSFLKAKPDLPRLREALKAANIPTVKHSKSCLAITTLFNTNGCMQVDTGDPISDPRAINSCNLQPADIMFFENDNLTDEQFKQLYWMTCIGRTYLWQYYPHGVLQTCTIIPYADLPYTGQPT